MGEILVLGLILLFPVFIIAAFILPIYFLRKQKMKKLLRDSGSCEECGKTAFRIKQTTVKGFIILYTFGYIDKHLCGEHGQKLYQSVKSYNLKNGWWSLLGVLRTPFVLQENQYEYKQFTKAFKKA